MNKKDKLLLLSAIEVAIIDYYNELKWPTGDRDFEYGLCNYSIWRLINPVSMVDAEEVFDCAVRALLRAEKRRDDERGFFWKRGSLKPRLAFLERLFYHVENDLLGL